MKNMDKKAFAYLNEVANDVIHQIVESDIGCFLNRYSIEHLSEKDVKLSFRSLLSGSWFYIFISDNLIFKDNEIGKTIYSEKLSDPNSIENILKLSRIFILENDLSWYFNHLTRNDITTNFTILLKTFNDIHKSEIK